MVRDLRGVSRERRGERFQARRWLIWRLVAFDIGHGEILVERLEAAATRTLNATWQRCRIHFMGNLLAHAAYFGDAQITWIRYA